MKTKISSMIVVLAVAAWAGVALAQELRPGRAPEDRPKRPEQHGEEMGFPLGMLDQPRVASALNLTDEQKAQIKDKSFVQQKEMIRIRAELEMAGLEQARLVSAETTDTNALMQAVEKTGNLRTAMAKLQMKNLLELRNILTPEQRAKLHGVMAKLQERRREEGAAKGQRPGEARRGAEGRGRRPEARQTATEGAAADRPSQPAPAPQQGRAAENENDNE